MSRISIVTDEISQDLAECETFLRETDLHAVEVRAIGNQRVPALSKPDRERLREWAAKKDPRLVAVSPGLFKCQAEDRHEIQRHLGELLPKTIELGKELGATAVIAFGFFSPTFALAGGVVSCFHQAAERCAKAGLTLWVEFEPGTLVDRAIHAAELLERVDHPNLFLNWDPANTLVMKTEPLTAELKRVMPWIQHVHVKNGRIGRDGTYQGCTLREGQIDWETHLRVLQDAGYAGYLSVETHCLPFLEKSRIVVNELKDMLAKLNWAEGVAC